VAGCLKFFLRLGSRPSVQLRRFSWLAKVQLAKSAVDNGIKTLYNRRYTDDDVQLIREGTILMGLSFWKEVYY